MLIFSKNFIVFTLSIFFWQFKVKNCKLIVESNDVKKLSEDESSRFFHQQHFDLIYEKLSFLKERIDSLTQKPSIEAIPQNCTNYQMELALLIRKLEKIIENQTKISEVLILRKPLQITDIPSNCIEATRSNSGIYDILVPQFSTKPFEVFCEEDIEHGGWIVIQRRVDGSVDFNRNWEEYKEGFGDLRGEFFIGLDKLHALTTLGPKQELYISMKSYSAVSKYAKYSSFAIGDESENYVLKNLGNYSGDAGNEFSPHVGEVFSTKDRNNNHNTWIPCAEKYKAGWWFGNCYNVLLNGLYFPTNRDGIQWRNFEKEWTQLQFVQMMIRPVSAE